jgi:flagellar biosynthesis protein FlhF
MKLRKFFGLTSRSVLEQVRAELGADAVIVANHATSDGVEVTALAGDAIDTLLAHGKRPAPEATVETPAATPVAIAERNLEAAKVGAERRAESTVRKPPLAIVGDDDESFVPETPESIAPPALVAAPLQAEAIAPQLMAEVAAMREMIEERFALMSWNDSLRRRPLAAKFTRDLLAAGYSSALARMVTERLPDDMNPSQAREWVVKVLARNLRCVDRADEIVARGGVFALIGPTGVGKTTTTAKLAARCAMRYGASRLALITTDSFRIGAQDQLRIYAKILGVAVHTVSDRHDLRQALDAVRGRHLVLIDTVGMSQRDARVAEQSMLLAQPEIRRILLLNAAAQGETLDEVVESYGRVPDAIDESAASALAGCIVTKQDEAGKLGAALDVAVRHKLPLHYVTSGQRVPEDLFVPTSELMIERSLRGGTKPSAFSLTGDDLSLTIAGCAGVAHA